MTLILRSADDDNRARRVMHAVLADRAEQRLGEAAMAAAADHQQVGASAASSRICAALPSRTVELTLTGLAGSTVSLIAPASTRAAVPAKSESIIAPIGANGVPPYATG